MLVEHITLTGKTIIHHTGYIEKRTIMEFKEFYTAGCRQWHTNLPNSDLQIHLSLTNVDAMFSVHKYNNKHAAYHSCCCFEERYSAGTLSLVAAVAEGVIKEKPRLPVLSNWIYTVPDYWHTLSEKETILYKEAEINIYYSLFLARQK